MPELPEVETIRAGLAPFLTHAHIKRVTLNRRNLRFDFPENFVKNLEGTIIVNVGRRAKYLLFELSSGQTMLSHLGMTGNFRFFNPSGSGAFEKHDHVVFELESQKQTPYPLPAPFLVYSDPRRFGFMDIFENPQACKFLSGLGPEPLGNEFTSSLLAQSFARRRGPVKTVLLDQRVLAGLGNIYVCEALFRSGIHPATSAASLVQRDTDKLNLRLEGLRRHIRDVLEEALVAGGSTLSDYKNVEGETGYFQHRFSVYGREGEPCRASGCHGVIERFVQSGRSTFFCPCCQPS